MELPVDLVQRAWCLEVTDRGANRLAAPDYGNQAVQRVRAIAGNGRIAGLQQAYSKGTAGGYANEMARDTLHGVRAPR